MNSRYRLNKFNVLLDTIICRITMFIDSGFWSVILADFWHSNLAILGICGTFIVSPIVLGQYLQRLVRAYNVSNLGVLFQTFRINYGTLFYHGIVVWIACQNKFCFGAHKMNNHGSIFEINYGNILEYFIYNENHNKWTMVGFFWAKFEIIYGSLYYSSRLLHPC